MCYDKQVYVLSALDPIHIGTGGYRMDRVDNTIIRDMDGIPKIPGSSLSGAIRSYAALANKSSCGGNNGCKDVSNLCEICETFGYTTSEKSRKGLVSFYDARILLFPVATMAGPVWITTLSNCVEFLEMLNEDEISLSINKNEFIPLSNNYDLGKKTELRLDYVG